MTLALRFVYDNSPRVFSIVPVRNSSIFEAIILQEISGRAYLLFMGLYRFALSAWFEENIYYIWKICFLSLSLSLSLSFPVWLFLLILLSCLTLGHTKIGFKVELKQTHRNTDMASVWNGFYGFRIIRTGWIWKQPAQWWQNKVKCSKTGRGPMASETWNNV